MTQCSGVPTKGKTVVACSANFEGCAQRSEFIYPFYDHIIESTFFERTRKSYSTFIPKYNEFKPYPRHSDSAICTKKTFEGMFTKERQPSSIELCFSVSHSPTSRFKDGPLMSILCGKKNLLKKPLLLWFSMLEEG